MDSLLVYIVARLCLLDRAAMITLIKCLALILIPLAFLGIIETITGWQPYVPLHAFCPWGIGDIKEPRFGFHRAIGPFDQPILFGLFFVMSLLLVFHLRNVPDYPRNLAYLITGIVIAGAVSSMSSGPVVMMGVAVFCMVMERFKHRIRPLIIAFVICCILVEIISNRHFYHVFAGRVNPLAGAGTYRARLIDSAIQHFGEWWLVGYRGLDPGWTKRTFTDIPSMLIGNGVRYGILGIITFYGMLICSIRNMVRLYNSSSDSGLRSWAWVLCSVLVLMLVASIGSNIRTQVQSLFFIILAMAGSSSNFILRVVRNSDRQTPFALSARNHSGLKCWQSF